MRKLWKSREIKICHKKYDRPIDRKFCDLWFVILWKSVEILTKNLRKILLLDKSPKFVTKFVKNLLLDTANCRANTICLQNKTPATKLITNPQSILLIMCFKLCLTLLLLFIARSEQDVCSVQTYSDYLLHYEMKCGQDCTDYIAYASLQLFIL